MKNKKYDLSKIMKAAWYAFKNKTLGNVSFGECLKQAWAATKEIAAKVAKSTESIGIYKNVQVAGTLCNPVMVEIDTVGLTVSGNTFPARKVLKEAGLYWDATCKNWFGSKDAINALIAKFA